MIKTLRISGFRRLRDISLPMRPLAVLIGANGSGKTSFLEALQLISNSALGRLSDSLSDLGGIQDVLTSGRSSELVFSLEFASGQDDIKYEMQLEPQGFGHKIRSELLTQQFDINAPQPFKHIEVARLRVRFREPQTSIFIEPTWDFDYTETALSQVPKMYSGPEHLRSALAYCQRYGALDVGPRSPVRLPQKLGPAEFPGTNGEDLVSCLYYLRETNSSRFEAVEDSLRVAFPTFDRLNFPPVAAGTAVFTWKDKDYDKPFYASQLSEGTLRFLWLVTTLQAERLPTITLIDEPEVSLHPAMLGVLADLLREASKRTQLVVATHSDMLLRFLSPSEVLICDTEDGETHLTWADSAELDVAKWLDEYTLDEVWNMNLVGGRP